MSWELWWWKSSASSMQLDAALPEPLPQGGIGAGPTLNQAGLLLEALHPPLHVWIGAGLLLPPACLGQGCPAPLIPLHQDWGQVDPCAPACLDLGCSAPSLP